MKTMKTISCLLISVIGMTMSIFGVSSFAEVGGNALTDAQMACVVGAGVCQEPYYCCEAPEYEEYEASERERSSWPDPEPGCVMKESGWCVNVFLHLSCSEEYWCEECITYPTKYTCEDAWSGCGNIYLMGTCVEYEEECDYQYSNWYWCDEHPALYDDPVYCWET